jgi:hypothetical protein
VVVLGLRVLEPRRMNLFDAPQPTGPVMLSLCDRTTAMCRPWADAGYTCLAVDLQHDPGVTIDGNIWRVGADLRTFLPPLADYVFVAAFPPCTNLAVSGARWFRDKGLRGLIDGLELVERAAEVCQWTGAPWMLENPVSTISTYWREPDHQFHPWEYGGYEGGRDDGYTKTTCLWTGGGFRMPARRPIPLAEDHDRIHMASPGPERGDARSITPAGFARAVWEANDPALRAVDSRPA